MEGFKKPAKMQCFKEGGSVKYESRKEHKEEMSADIKQDKAIVKKAIGMHDKQEHKGEKTDLSKLKKGGRAKKELGSARKFIKPAAAPSGAKKEPNKYKVGGAVTNVYEAKKKAGDLDAIEAVKNIKPGKAEAPSKASVVSKNTPAKFCGGKSVKKYADGRSVVSDLMQAKELARLANARKYLGKGQQGQFAASESQQTPAMTGMGQQAAQAAAPAPAQMPAVDQTGAPTGMMAQKKGGKVKKMNTGGTCS
jgi:hypothetical protein